MRGFHSWWRRIKTHLVATILVIAVLTLVALVMIGGYLLHWDWTGFNGKIKSGKMLWDWLQLLIVPLALALVALVFQRATTRTEQQITQQRYENDKRIIQQRYEQDQQIALNKQREDLLQAYLDRMSELLLKEQLRSSAVDAEVRNVARVRTITILFQLDARRIGYVFAFLREAGLMSTTPNDSIVSLKDADLSEADLSEADLSNAVVTEEQLKKASSLEHAIMPDGSVHP